MDQRISVLGLSVTDMARARAFYESGLGLKAFDSEGRYLLLSIQRLCAWTFDR